MLKSKEELKALEQGIVVIRAHGVGKEIYELLEKRGLKIVDSSCPFVRKIQKLVFEHSKAGESVIVMGDPEHPEIQGILGWGDGDVTALKGIEEVLRLPDGNGKKFLLWHRPLSILINSKQFLKLLKKGVSYICYQYDLQRNFRTAVRSKGISW